MRRLLLGSAALAALLAVDVALAADLEVRPAPPAQPIQYPDWTGIYVGVEGGSGWGNDLFGFGGKATTLDPHDFITFSEPLVQFGTRVFDLPLVIPGINTINTSGHLFGGFAGAQQQLGSWVVGIEADFDGANMTGSASSTVVTTRTTKAQPFQTTTLAFAGPPIYTVATTSFGGVYNPGATSTTTSNLSVTRAIDELASVRGKIGFAPWQYLMIYGTGGLALAHQNTDISFNQTTTGLMIGVDNSTFFHTAPTIPFTTSTSAAASNGAVLFGWAAGTGVDYKLTRNVLLGAEYLHYDFGKVGFSLNNSGGVSLAGSGKTTVDAVKARISWLFN